MSRVTHNSSLAAELRSFLASRLPDYMVPSAFVPLDALPHAPSGKVDYKALPAPDPRASMGHDFAAPRTPTEERIARIWAEILKQEQVSIHDNFFDLGGHSLLAAQVTARLSAALGVDVQVRSLFEAPTVAGLAAIVERAQSDAARPPAIARLPRERYRASVAGRDAFVFPVSFAQQRLWLLDQLTPGDLSYTIPLAVRLGGKLDVRALQRSLDAIVQRHEVLRTTFAAIDGQEVQVVAPALALDLPIVDVSGAPAAQRELRAQQLASEEARRPFDLARGPLLRATLLRLAEGEHMLLLNMHHIIADGWSAGILIREISAQYAGYVVGRPAALPELPVQYADYAVWQRGWLRGEPLERQRDYWRRRLGGRLAALELPTDYPRPAIASSEGDQRSIVLPEPLIAALGALAQQENATLFMVLLAAFQALLFRYSGQDDIVVGSPIAGRTRPELEELIGFFVNMLALRTDLSGNPSFRALLGRVREVCLGAYAHQDVPFEQIVEDVLPRRDLSRTPIFTVALALQNAPRPALELPNLTLQPLEVTSGTAKYDLTFNFVPVPGGLHGSLEYRTDLFEAATIERALEHYRTLLEGVAANPDQRLSELPLMSEAERLLLEEWSIA